MNYESICLEILKNYNCTKCGFCCKKTNLFLTNDELKVICDKLKIREESIKTKKGYNNYLILDTPCPFLKNNICTVHEFRPYVCRVFPFSCGIISLQSLKTCNLSRDIYKDLKSLIGNLPDIENISVENAKDNDSKTLIENFKQREKTISAYLDEDKTLEKEISMVFSFSVISDFFEFKNGRRN